MTPSQYICLLERHVQKWGNNYAAARDMGCSPAMLSLVLSGQRNPTKKMLAATGHFERITVKRQIFKEAK